MTPIEGSINADNFGGIFSEFATDFTPEFYDNSRVENTAQTIEVQAGQTVRKIDFTTGFIRPGFPSVELSGLAANTPDTTGPYTVRVQAINTDQLWLHYRSSLALSDRIPMRSAGENLFATSAQANPSLHKLSIALRRATTPLTKSSTQKTSVGSALTSSNSAVPPWPLQLRGSDFISVVDTDARARQARIAVGDEPIQIIAGPAGHFLYVSNLSSNEISVISAATFQEVERIETAVQPLDMAISFNLAARSMPPIPGLEHVVDLETLSPHRLACRPEHRTMRHRCPQRQGIRHRSDQRPAPHHGFGRHHTIEDRRSPTAPLSGTESRWKAALHHEHGGKMY